MKISFRSTLLFCIFPVLFFLLTGSTVSAVEKVQVSPSSLSLKKGESKNLTLTGKNLKNANTALVFLKDSPIKEFDAKLTCKGTARCVVSLTLQGLIAEGDYSVKLFDAKNKLLAEGLFKVSPLSGSKITSSGRSLRSKPKQAPLEEKAIPRSSRSLRSPSRQTPQAEKTTPPLSPSLRSQPKQAPPAEKAVPTRPSRDLKPRPKPAPPQNTPPSTPEKIRVSPSTVVLTVGKQQTLTLTGNKLRDIKRAVVFLGNIRKTEFQIKPNCNPIGRCTLDLTLKQKLIPGGYTLQLLNAQNKLTAVGQFRVTGVTSPVELASIKLAKQKAAPGEIMKGSIVLTGRAPSPKGVRIALSSSNSRIAKVKPVQIRAGQTRADFSFKTGSMPGNVKITAKLNKSTLITSLVVTVAPFASVTLNKGTFQMTGRRSIPFSPVTIDKGTFLMTGRRPDSVQAPDIPTFTPVVIDPGTFEVTGRGFVPVVIDPGTFEVTGRGFVPVVIEPGTFQVTGRRGEPEESTAETPTGGSAQDRIDELLNPDLGTILPGLLGGGAESGGSTPEDPPAESPPATPPAESTPERVFSFDPGTLQMTGREKPEESAAETPPVENLFTFDPGTFKMTGRRGMAD